MHDQMRSSHTTTLEAVPGRVQDLQRRSARSKIRQDGVSPVALYTIPPRVARTVWHDCKLPLLAYKRRGSHLAAGGRRIAHTCTFSVSTTILASHLDQTSGTWRHYLLSRHACSSPLQAPRCSAIQCLEHTPAGRTAPARTKIKLVPFSCLAPAIEK
jgi:hypothetical protein